MEFSRRKYGPELLVDAAMLSAMPAFTPIAEPHTLEFYDLLLITDGAGTFELDDERHVLSPAQLLITRPGQVRRWDVTRVDGACVFFTIDFIRQVFADTRILDQFAFFDRSRPSGAMQLSDGECRQFLMRFERMGEELGTPRPDAAELLRARLYELLVLLNRWYGERHRADRSREDRSANRRGEIVERFAAMVDREFRVLHRVQDYALRLHVSTGHLSELCTQQLGRTASAHIHQRQLLEAKRLLRYTDKPAFAIAQELGFPDPAYFGRFFRREAGVTPRRFRTEQ